MRHFPIALLIVLALAPVAAARPHARAAKSCSLSSAERGGSKPSTLGPTYVTSLSATGTSCAKAKRVVRAFHRCRLANGRAGRCARKVRRYRCSEQRSSSPAQIDSSVTCKRGSRRVTHRYTQNT